MILDNDIHNRYFTLYFLGCPYSDNHYYKYLK